jgi:hypothetical protein
LASVCELLIVAFVAAACGGAAGGGAVNQPIPFVDHGTTQQSANDGGPRLVVTTDPSQTGLGPLPLQGPPPVGQPAPSSQSGRLYIAVFAGSKRTGGFAVQVDRVERQGDRLVVQARFTEPAAGAITIQVLTSPAQLVSIDRSQASGIREAVLVDQKGTELTRITVRQSQS